MTLTRKELTQKPARARLARADELDSDTAVLIKGGKDRNSGTEPKQRRWKVFRDPRRRIHGAREILRMCNFFYTYPVSYRSPDDPTG